MHATHLLLAVLALAAAARAQFDYDKLFPVGKTCPKTCDAYSPCCMDGWCMSSPFGCMRSEGCIEGQSFNGKSCTPVPMCKSFREDFNDPAVLIDRTNYTDPNSKARFWRQYPGADNAEVENGNLVLALKWSDQYKQGRGATIPSLRFMQYGTVSARIKIASGVGVVNSFITKTSIRDDIGDEIDFEMLGGNTTEIQTNFYVDGQLDYTRGARYRFPPGSGQTTDSDYHVYEIDWTAERMIFRVDGNVIRTVRPSEVDNKYPKQLMRLYFSIWDGGCNMAEGTVKWAGGVTDWCNDESKRATPKKMYIDWIEVKCATEDTADPNTYVAKVAKANASGSNSGSGSNADAPVRTTAPSTGSGGSGNAGDITGGPNAASGLKAGVAAAVTGVAVAAVAAMMV